MGLSTTTDATAKKVQPDKGRNRSLAGATPSIRLHQHRADRLRCYFNRHRWGGGTVMRYFICLPGLMAPLAQGIVCTTCGGGLVASSGCTHRGAARRNRAVLGAVAVAAITVRADQHLFVTGNAVELSRWCVHGPMPWSARQGAALRETLRMQRPCRHCQVRGVASIRRSNFMAMSRLLLHRLMPLCTNATLSHTPSIPPKRRSHSIAHDQSDQGCFTSGYARRETPLINRKANCHCFNQTD